MGRDRAVCSCAVTLSMNFLLRECHLYQGPFASQFRAPPRGIILIFHGEKHKIDLCGNYLLRTFGLPISILAVLAVTVACLVPNTFGQDAVQPVATNFPSPENQPSAEPSPAFQASQTAAGSPIVDINGQAVAETPRRFHFAFQLTVRGVYDDNINLTQSNKQGDFYTSIEPVISFGLGGTGGDQTDFLSFVYAPNGYIFADNSNADALQHVIHVAAQRQFAKLTLGVNEDIQILNSTNLTSLSDTTGRQANVDVGQRTKENIFTTNANLSYDLSSKTFLSAGGNYQVYDYPSLISSETVSGSLSINYNYGAKVIVGIGGTGGYDTAEGLASDQYFEQGNLQLSYRASGKINFSGSVGIEVRQFANNARDDYISPVFNLNGTYQPFDGTFISLTGSRTTQNSGIVNGADFASTKIDVGIRQRFLQRVSLGVNGGYENDNYFSVANNVDVTRDDDYYYIQSSIDVNVTRYWTVGAYYLHREDASSLDAFGFSDNQFGARTTLTF